MLQAFSENVNSKVGIWTTASIPVFLLEKENLVEGFYIDYNV